MNITCVVKSLLKSDIVKGFMELRVNNYVTLSHDINPVLGNETDQVGQILWKETHQYQLNWQKSAQGSNFSCLLIHPDGETYESKTVHFGTFSSPTYSTSVTSHPETRNNLAIIAGLVPSLAFFSLFSA
jgi:hypothetical protein